MKIMVNELNLKVAEAVQDDVNKGIVRIDKNYMDQIEVSPGDIVEIEGQRKTVAIADRAYPGDIGLNIIRLDGIIRMNAKTSIGEIIKVRKIKVEEATKVTIAPARKGMVIRAAPQLFKQGLLGRAVVKGDILSIGGTTWQSPSGTLLDVVESREPWVLEALARLQTDPQGLPVLSLPYLALMKVQASRTQDLADVSRMLGLASADERQATRRVFRRWYPGALDDLESLIALGELEMAAGDEHSAENTS